MKILDLLHSALRNIQECSPRRRQEAHPLDGGIDAHDCLVTLGLVAAGIGKAPRCLGDELRVERLTRGGWRALRPSVGPLLDHAGDRRTMRRPRWRNTSGARAASVLFALSLATLHSHVIGPFGRRNLVPELDRACYKPFG